MKTFINFVRLSLFLDEMTAGFLYFSLFLLLIGGSEEENTLKMLVFPLMQHAQSKKIRKRTRKKYKFYNQCFLKLAVHFQNKR